MSEHRVTMLGASWRRFEDPTRSRDPRIRTLVAALATLPAPELRAEFRTELRTQLVAIAPRVIAETAGATAPLGDIVPGETSVVGRKTATAGGARHSDSVFAKIRRIPIGRPLTVVASVITAFALLLGGAVWMSKKALPGDALYGLKRASENAELALDGSATDKARDYLKFAGTRVDEARALASRASASAAGAGPQAGSIDSHTASLITSTLSSADSDVKSASSLLGKQAVQDKSSSPLNVITAWAPSQLSRLHKLAAAMPDGALRTRTQSSAQLVTAAVTRAQELAPNVSSVCVDNAVQDDLGPMPNGACTSGSTTPPTTGQRSTVPGHPTSTGATQSGGTVVGTQEPNGSTSTPAATSGGSESPTSGLHLPSLPLPTPTASIPVSVDTCGVGATLGPIGIGIGLCSGLHLSLTP